MSFRCQKALEYHNCDDLLNALHHVVNVGSKLKYDVCEIENKLIELNKENK